MTTNTKNDLKKSVAVGKIDTRLKQRFRQGGGGGRGKTKTLSVRAPSL